MSFKFKIEEPISQLSTQPLEPVVQMGEAKTVEERVELITRNLQEGFVIKTIFIHVR